MKKSLLIIFFILLVDQVVKFWIKLNMTLGEEIHVFDWFIIHFTENEGMAFGLSFGGEFGKLALSLFRLAAIIAIAWYLNDLVKKKTPYGLVFSITLILAGAIGNVLDSAFYGLIFSNSSYHTLATFLPEGGGYSSFLHGKVVDLFYFPIITGYYPDWVPFWGGNDFIFFRPVFNVADSSITIGVLMLILFQRRYFVHSHRTANEDDASNEEGDSNTPESESASAEEHDIVETQDEAKKLSVTDSKSQ